MKKLILIIGLALAGQGLMAQEFALSTNAVDYANGGTLNLEASMGLARHFSLNAGVKYNPFEYGEGEDMKLYNQRLFSVGSRWWPWHIYSELWVGVKAQYQEFRMGGLKSEETTEGDRYGGGVAIGYSKLVGKHFNIDVGVGLWAGYAIYTKYSCQTCGSIVEKSKGPFVLPNDLILGLNYIF